VTKRTSAKYKIDRRMGENIWGRPKSPVNRREYGPGQHGQRRKGKVSDFGLQLRADILQVPHHGSRSSSSHGFINAVQPSRAVVSAGFLNPFAHPAEAIRERYRRRGIPLYVSAETGMIEFRIDGQHNAAPVLWRRQFPRPWRAQAPARFMVE